MKTFTASQTHSSHSSGYDIGVLMKNNNSNYCLLHKVYYSTTWCPYCGHNLCKYFHNNHSQYVSDISLGFIGFCLYIKLWGVSILSPCTPRIYLFVIRTMTKSRLFYSPSYIKFKSKI
jgi:hypothetical protein